MAFKKVSLIFILLLFSITACQHHYNLYATDIANDFTHTCIYYALSYQYEADSKTYGTRQLLEYCFRLSSEEIYDFINGSISSILTFDQLKTENVTVENLIKWSSPVDVIEHYQEFLDLNDASSTEVLYNCTEPWFGTFCQYRFPLRKHFSDIVYATFDSRRDYRFRGTATCYMYIKCDRGSPFLCLDWREICDGKIDCLDGGEDEKYCLDLYMNECAENEYQCRNGMCIDKIFLLDSAGEHKLSYECLDLSDEVVKSLSISPCSMDPSFRCEETICFYPQHFNCGDGSCVSDILPKSFYSCWNTRDDVFNYLLDWDNYNLNRFPPCFKIAICVSNLFSSESYAIYCQSLCGSIEECKINLQRCPSYMFAPNFPVWDGHVRLGFFSNETITQYNNNVLPHFICFDQKKCPLLFTTFKLHSFTCFRTDMLNFSSYNDLYNMFIPCIHLYENIDKNSRSMRSILHCPGTNKYIPKRYVVDGIADCYGAFDESIAANSCALNDTYRFQCTSENKCLLPTLIKDEKYDCIGKEDGLAVEVVFHRFEQLPFSAICDGRVDLISSSNETDETHCEFWPCSNQYTRCNIGWSCLNGMDELDCPSQFSCPKDHHPCMFPKNNTIGCLHYSRANDGIVDCVGSADERTYCRIMYPHGVDNRYRCWNNTRCVVNVNAPHECETIYHTVDAWELNSDNSDNILLYINQIGDFWLTNKKSFSILTSNPFPKPQHRSYAKKLASIKNFRVKQLIDNNELDPKQVWFCNRGILIYSGFNQSEQCLCPPSYYGNRCQYQSQRVSLTLLFRNEYFNKFTVIGIVITLVDSAEFIHSYEQIIHIPALNCNTKYNIYLLYQDRPKDATKNYTVHIDVYDKTNLIHLTSLILPVKLHFMPVNRLSTQLTIPRPEYCEKLCKSKSDIQLNNMNRQFCRCQSQISTETSMIVNKCNCSLDSLCVGMINNRPICLCPLTKNSPRCFLRSICQKNPCMNGGLCVPLDHRISFTNFKCVCQDGFYGIRCQQKDVKIHISFVDIPIPQFMLLHFLTMLKHHYTYRNYEPVRATMFQKIKFDQKTVTFFMSLPFHLAFSQIQNKYYLTVLQHNFTPSLDISTEISPSQYCPHIQELFNKSISHYPIIRRVKYYHLLCMENSTLTCFHDNELFMCLCTTERHANCFHFDFNMTYDCAGWNKCENQAQCFQDSPLCPSKIACVCRECFYGTLCQFSTQQFGLSLDAILGYQIRPHLSISRQTLYVKISIGVSFVILILGLLFGFLSILTFQSRACQKVGCGRYLLASSITSILTVISLNIKLWFLLLSQMLVITSRSFLLFDCISTEYVLGSLLAMNDWYHAAVAVERLLAVILHVKFNLSKSKKVARYLTLIIPLFIFISLVHDPIHRDLIDDEEEQRTWCLSRLSSNTQNYDSFINIFHFLVPFVLKVISALGIVILIAEKRSIINQQKSFVKNMTEQLQKHKNLLISSSLLVVLALPRVILAFSSGCMKSQREPTLFLVGYFMSFVPSLLVFFIFIIASKTYKREFKTAMTKKWAKVRSLFSQN